MMPECDWCGECDWCRLLHFPWPCSRRDAHGRHVIHPPGVVMGHPGEPCVCRGVPAHPLTMAGKR